MRARSSAVNRRGYATIGRSGVAVVLAAWASLSAGGLSGIGCQYHFGKRRPGRWLVYEAFGSSRLREMCSGSPISRFRRSAS